MSRDLTEIERAALEPLVIELEAVADQRRHIEAKIQRLCALMVEDGQVVDLENMTVMTLNTENGNAEEGREQDR